MVNGEYYSPLNYSPSTINKNTPNVLLYKKAVCYSFATVFKSVKTAIRTAFGKQCGPSSSNFEFKQTEIL